MAWNTDDLRVEILQEFAHLSGSGWSVIDIPPAYDPEEEGNELTLAQRARQRRERLMSEARPRRMSRKKVAAAL